jgi:hypothetical protein
VATKKRGRPRGPDIADRFVAVAEGRAPHPVSEQDALRSMPPGTVKARLRALAAKSGREGDEFERLRKLRKRRGYTFDPD